MLPDDSRPRLLGSVTALHWTATFGVMAAAAHGWRPGGSGAAVSRLAEPFLQGALANADAAFALAVLFVLIGLGFFWLLLVSAMSGPSADRDFAEVSQLAYAGGVGGTSVAGGFAAVAGSAQALLISSALIAALVASALATSAGRVPTERRNSRAARAAARSMAISAAEQSLRSRFAPISGEKDI